jgi:hypothetical protein
VQYGQPPRETTTTAADAMKVCKGGVGTPSAKEVGKAQRIMTQNNLNPLLKSRHNTFLTQATITVTATITIYLTLRNLFSSPVMRSARAAEHR